MANTSLSNSQLLPGSELSFLADEVRLKVFLFLEKILPQLKSTFIGRVNDLYLFFLGACEVVQNYEQQEAEKELKNIKNIQNWLLRYETLLEKANYLNDAQIEEKWNLCIDSLYKLEGELRIRAYAGDKSRINNAHYINALSGTSTAAINNILSAYSA